MSQSAQKPRSLHIDLDQCGEEIQHMRKDVQKTIRRCREVLAFAAVPRIVIPDLDAEYIRNTIENKKSCVVLSLRIGGVPLVAENEAAA